jgi:hypothetical protein
MRATLSAHPPRSSRGKAPFPFVAGNEGVGQVEAVGSGVKGLAAGDFVVASTPGMGASHALPRTGRRRRCVAAAPTRARRHLVVARRL